ncbi:MAG TPA: hypothetical protein VM755_21510 [Stellaceae bacterium]|nr:hypothetical protein [Stellaceae bacterium]
METELLITAAVYRRFAKRCRELLPRARTEAARERLRIIAAEIDAQAEELELAESLKGDP